MDWDHALKVLDTGAKLKSQMIKRNLSKAKAKCPHCENGFVHGRLAGPKKHLHMYCDSCSAQMME